MQHQTDHKSSRVTMVREGDWSGLTDLLSSDSYRLSKVFVLVDGNTEAHCLPLLQPHLPHPENVHILRIAAGEEFKSIQTCEFLWTALSKNGADRNALLVNLGGGVICDLGGFVASTFKRGIRFINIPTTLLSQVDASIGGKVGIDLNVIKNQVGLFVHPLAIFVNPSFPDTLDERERRSGYAEMLKIALIADPKLWTSFLAEGYPDSLRDLRLLARVIDLKESITEADLYEQGPRKTLNFGHTTGHAIESWYLQTGKSRVLHGEAVAAGMLIESWISARLGGLSENDFTGIDQYICDVFPHIDMEEDDVNGIFAGMIHDKKNRMGRLNFTLLEGIGHAITDNYPGEELIMEGLEWYRKLGG